MDTTDMNYYTDEELEAAYAAIGLTDEEFEELDSLLNACLNFYGYIDLNHAWEAIEKVKKGSYNREKFEAFVSSQARNLHSCTIVFSEDHFFTDGDKNIYFLINLRILAKHSSEPSEKDEQEFIDHLIDDENQNAEKKFVYDESVFYDLYDQKPEWDIYYYPEDLAEYENPLYCGNNPQVREMKRFLVKSLRYTKAKAQAITNLLYFCMNNMFLNPELDNFLDIALSIVENEDVPFTKASRDTFTVLLQNFYDNARMRFYNGFTPTEASCIENLLSILKSQKEAGPVMLDSDRIGEEAHKKDKP